MRSAGDFTHIYLHREPVDFRKSINGLSIIVEQKMELSPFNSSIFVFINKHRDKLKILYWDNTGFCLWYKRLEKAKFKWPKKHHHKTIELNHEQMDWLLRGFDISNIKPHASLHFDSLS